MIGGRDFALCLTHDVDRTRMTFQAPYHAVKRRDVGQLRTLFTAERPYWQFEEIMDLEDRLGVRSSFYFLEEKRLLWDKPPREWLRPTNWIQYTGFYSLDDPEIEDVIRRLDDGGWEVGLHGSFDSYADPDRLRAEKRKLERVLGHPPTGIRQHYLNLDVPETWRRQRDIGLRYDASLGSGSEYGFAHGYGVKRPFDDEFLVFPLTVMDVALTGDTTDLARARDELDRLLREAAEHGAVMTALWHPRLFNSDIFPGYRELYRHLVVRAKEMDAWIGPVEDAYRFLTE